jgi:hypothetical protein
VFERGQVEVGLAATSVTDCELNRSPAEGLLMTPGTSAVMRCSAQHNRLTGLALGARPAANCTGSSNRSHGIVTLAAASNCRATDNMGIGITAGSVTACEATRNGATGIVASGAVTESTADDNVGDGLVCSSGHVTTSSASGNLGRGIVIGGGMVSGCTARRNGGGGIATNGSMVQDSIVSDNSGVGLAGSGSSSALRCVVSRNTGTAMTGVQTIAGCTVSGNVAGLINVLAVTGSHEGGNLCAGITGGTLADSTVIDNCGHGIVNPTSVANCFVADNGGAGISGNNSASVTFCTSSGNAGGGVSNLGAASLNFSNIFGNSVFNAADSQVRSGFQIKNFESNYWGPSLTDWMTSNPFPADCDPEIADGFDGANGWFLDYTPHATAPLSDAPDAAPPVFLRSVTPNLLNAVNVGETTFTLVFSGPMNTAVMPSVTFGLVPPFEEHVVAPAPGWIAADTWQGRFAVETGTGDGTNTLLVAGAVAASGWSLPEDMSNRFVVDADGAGAANNGVATAIGTASMSLMWSEEDKPPTAQGYNVRRSTTGLPGSYAKVNGPLLVTPSYLDTGLNAGTVYYYIVDLVDSGTNSVQWTPPFFGATQPKSCVNDWSLY